MARKSTQKERSAELNELLEKLTEEEWKQLLKGLRTMIKKGLETPPGETRYYTLTEVEPWLRVTHRTLLSWVKTGKIHAEKVAGKWLITEEELMEHLNKGK